MQERILEFLKKKQDYVSGEEMSHRFGITRQGLWKHIQELKEKGYEIIAVPHVGYKLVHFPDRLFPAEIGHSLTTSCVGKKIFYFDEVTSTMDKATELALQGAPEGSVVVAECQTKGRGRLGRRWLSPKHKGLYFSLVLRPEISPGQAAVITLLVAVSLCEAIRAACGIEVSIKWPNDLLAHHKKFGGILTELNAEMDQIRFINVGVGLNVNNDHKSLLPGTTSLKELKKVSVNRVELLQEALRHIDELYSLFQKQGSGPVIERWREHAITLGRRVRVTVHHQDEIEGEAIDIDSDGGLLLRKDSGFIQKVTAGDVVHCR
jgi:BirA family biotin operon repressor/biotin-[acetyl-CoA-carboxylase] ligase